MHPEVSQTMAVDVTRKQPAPFFGSSKPILACELISHPQPVNHLPLGLGSILPSTPCSLAGGSSFEITSVTPYSAPRTPHCTKINHKMASPLRKHMRVLFSFLLKQSTEFVIFGISPLSVELLETLS